MSEKNRVIKPNLVAAKRPITHRKTQNYPHNLRRRVRRLLPTTRRDASSVPSRYCDSTCQHDHWRRMTTSRCVNTPAATEQYHADKIQEEPVAVSESRRARRKNGTLLAQLHDSAALPYSPKALHREALRGLRVHVATPVDNASRICSTGLRVSARGPLICRGDTPDGESSAEEKRGASDARGRGGSCVAFWDRPTPTRCAYSERAEILAPAGVPARN